MNNTSRMTEAFVREYGREPAAASFAPYRVCPLGAHVDHNLGWVTGFAIDRGIRIAYAPRTDGVIEVCSLGFPGRAMWHIAQVPPAKQGDWADHLRGATIALGKRYELSTGLSAVIAGELPIGGLSSSAAVIIAYLSALASVNNIRLSAEEMIETALETEHSYVGVFCGRLDQSCEVYCRRDHLLYMDMKTGEHELIPQPQIMAPFEIAVFHSGLERSLAGSRYNMRVDEARAAAYALLAYAGCDYGRFGETNLRDVPFELYCEHGSKLPEPWRRRAEHWYTESARVKDGVAAWRDGDITEFGRLIFESGKSSIYSWETGSPELCRLYEIMTETDGVYGGRFSGAGFKGCCVALIDPAYREAVLDHVGREYLRSFPQLSGRYSAHICHTADGVYAVL